jgi:hypothetical protein
MASSKYSSELEFLNCAWINDQRFEGIAVTNPHNHKRVALFNSVGPDCMLYENVGRGFESFCCYMKANNTRKCGWVRFECLELHLVCANGMW